MGYVLRLIVYFEALDPYELYFGNVDVLKHKLKFILNKKKNKYDTMKYMNSS
jgi:hypothetical protein